jgi:hypothetical protein
MEAIVVNRAIVKKNDVLGEQKSAPLHMKQIMQCQHF